MIVRPYLRDWHANSYACRKSNLIRQWGGIGRCFLAMVTILRLIWGAIKDFFRSQADLQTEIIALRHQLNVLRRKRPERLDFGNTDRLLFVWVYRLAPGTTNALSIVKPETVIGWHRRRIRALWRWKSRSTAGRPKAPLEIRTLIREMSIANPLWGAPRIHGELLKLGIDVG